MFFKKPTRFLTNAKRWNKPSLPWTPCHTWCTWMAAPPCVCARDVAGCSTRRSPCRRTCTWRRSVRGGGGRARPCGRRSWSRGRSSRSCTGGSRRRPRPASGWAPSPCAPPSSSSRPQRPRFRPPSAFRSGPSRRAASPCGRWFLR